MTEPDEQEPDLCNINGCTELAVVDQYLGMTPVGKDENISQAGVYLCPNHARELYHWLITQQENWVNART